MKKARHFIFYFLYTIFIGEVIVNGSYYLKKLESICLGKFDTMPYLYAYSFFPIIIGILISLPQIFLKIKRGAIFTVDWVLILSMGVPAFITALSPALRFTFLFPFSDILSRYEMLYTVFGLFLGYFAHMLFLKENNIKEETNHIC